MSCIEGRYTWLSEISNWRRIKTKPARLSVVCSIRSTSVGTRCTCTRDTSCVICRLHDTLDVWANIRIYATWFWTVNSVDAICEDATQVLMTSNWSEKSFYKPWGDTRVSDTSRNQRILNRNGLRPILTVGKLKPKTHEFSFSGSFGMRKLGKQAFFSVFSFQNFPKMKTRGFLVLVFGA